MAIPLTRIQKQRLRELNAPEQLYENCYHSVQERDKEFQKMEKNLVDKGRKTLMNLRDCNRRPMLCELEAKLVNALRAEGFVQVVTPVLLSKGLLEKMSITLKHPLSKQVYWVDNNKCLRPMLAPNLYSLLRRLVRLWEMPIRIFELGPCSRKETRGVSHLNQFTMLNLVELGLPEEGRFKRLEELAQLVMEAAGIMQYQFVMRSSDIYGETIDIVKEIELCSCAMGPIPLDEAWGIMDPWVGIGLGLERVIMVREGDQNIQRVGRSLIYLDGVRLNI